MREGIRDVLILMGVVFAGIQVYEGRNNLPPHPIVWPIIIAALFIIAGLLNVAPIVLRSLSRNTGKDKLDADDPFNNPQWETISNREFRNEAVEVDGKRFYSCKFINARLVFHGKAPCELLGDCGVGGSVVLETDNQPAMHYSHLMRIISSIPHIGEALLSV